jgi:hypothetical protein
MKLSRRDRILALVALLIVGAWLADSWVFSPLWRRYQADADRAASLETQLFQTEMMLRRQPVLARQWRGRLDDGVGRQTSQSEGALLNALEKWAGEAGLNITSMKPERETPRKDSPLQVIRCRVNLTGSMQGFVTFCLRLEGSTSPLRVEKMQWSANDSKKDVLNVQLFVSTVCLPPAAGGSGG